ncbi:MAG: PorT family protein [Bacteroidales bacterium]|nr:PorT family protein [Bacteroidales bacterium]
MKKIIILTFASLLVSSYASAQNFLSQLQGSLGSLSGISSMAGAGEEQTESAEPLAMNLLDGLRGTTVAGIVVGVNFGGEAEEGKTGSALERFNVGFATRVGLPLGFALQPSIMYTTKKLSVKGMVDKTSLLTSVGFIEVPVQLQWGVTIKKSFRPFIFAEPFIGYGITQKNRLFGDFSLEGMLSGSMDAQEGEEVAIPEIPDMKEIKEQIVNKLEYGIGGGVGVSYGPAQLSLKYYRNMGNLYIDETNIGSLGEAIKTAMKEKDYISGITLSLGLVF